MTDREILVSLYKDVQILNVQVGNIKCPSPKCAEHSKAIDKLEKSVTVLETTAVNQEKAGLSIQAWISIAAAVMVSFIGFGLEIYLAVKGG